MKILLTPGTHPSGYFVFVASIVSTAVMHHLLGHTQILTTFTLHTDIDWLHIIITVREVYQYHWAINCQVDTCFFIVWVCFSLYPLGWAHSLWRFLNHDWGFFFLIWIKPTGKDSASLNADAEFLLFVEVKIVGLVSRERWGITSARFWGAWGEP